MIAREHLKAGETDESIETVSRVKIERMENGQPKGWYQEQVIATSLAEIAATLCNNSDIAKAKSLADTAETELIRTAIMAAISSQSK